MEGDFISIAFKSYRDEKKHAFKFMHCWDVRRHATKWARLPLARESSKRKKTSSSQTCSDAHEVDLNMDDNDRNFEEELSRPPSRDKSKKGGLKDHLLYAQARVKVWCTSSS
ncbi:putative No apical meristem-associated domain-containing protein [Helianthus anomalus]